VDNGASSYRRFLAGDDTGIVEIIRIYKDGLILYLNGYLNNIYEAEEVMEDVFFKLVTKKPHFRSESAFKTWLFSIGRNLALDHLRKKRKTSNVSFEELENYIQEENTVEKEFLKAEEKIIVHKALNRLKPEYRNVLFLVYFEDFSNQEVAVILKKNKRQIENLIYRAKASLKTELYKEGYVYERL